MSAQQRQPVGSVLDQEGASIVHDEVLIEDRPVPISYVVREDVVEMWVSYLMTAHVPRRELASFFAGAESMVQGPTLTFTAPMDDDIPITLPKLQDWRLSPTARTRLRALVCGDRPKAPASTVVARDHRAPARARIGSQGSRDAGANGGGRP